MSRDAQESAINVNREASVVFSEKDCGLSSTSSGHVLGDN